MSVVIASSSPAFARSSAQSSPTPVSALVGERAK
jgi:hypothetical protein